MKRILLYIMIVASGFLMDGCGSGSDTAKNVTRNQETEISKVTESAIDKTQDTVDATEYSAGTTEDTADVTENETEELSMKLIIGETEVPVNWEENESVTELMKLTEENPLIINMSMYGGFEQVGSIGQSLPRDDKQTTTSSGDIVLYSGNQMVVFYGSNSWSYTRLGHISDKNTEDMTDLLSNGDVTITISIE